MKKKVNIKKVSKIANKIKKLSGINIFENTRQRKYVEARSLLSFVLKRYEKMTLIQIRDFYRLNGKDMNHATVIHGVKNFNIFKQYNTDLMDWLNIMSEDLGEYNNEAKRELIKLKLSYISNEDVDELAIVVDEMTKKQLSEV